MGNSAQSDHSLFRWVAVGSDPLDISAVAEFLSTPESGASVLFLGTVRNHAPGKTDVSHLEYEAYEGVVEPKIEEVVAEACERWPLHKVAALHRIGDLTVGEISVIAAASSAHRQDAFEGARYVIDELKKRAPIWKKEHYVDGHSGWVSCERCADHGHAHQEPARSSG